MIKPINQLKLLYRLVNPKQKAQIDRLRFKIGLLPRVTQVKTDMKWLPSPYKAALVISSDFELGWGFRYGQSQAGSLIKAYQTAEQTRRNLPTLLKMFDFYEIPITWATVGHLFLDSCKQRDGKSHSNLPRPPYFENKYWSYTVGDWYDADPCTDLDRAPEWYGSDLIRNILASKVNHEIGCHTFSHIDCSEEICPPELLRAELIACQQLATEFGIELKSFVFPANYLGNISTLKELGFENYRSPLSYHLSVPVLDKVGLCVIPGGVFWEKPIHWKVMEWESAIQHCVDLAIEKNLVLHLWFHPSCDEVNINQVFPFLLEYINARRNEIWAVTMKELSNRFLYFR
jgi:peptidoglycan/xylan/chitin deacetylase (PgdA/CDA1 family)